MGNKKKRSHNNSASTNNHIHAEQHIHEDIDSATNLDTRTNSGSRDVPRKGDGRSAYTEEFADPPLDRKAYEEAIRAHLNEFDDMSLNQVNGGMSNGTNGTSRTMNNTMSLNLPPSSSNYATVKSKKRTGVAPDDAKDRIWNTTTNEERERIKEFWLNLGEEERKSLVKVEKEAVLKKMKEQQKHSCSCSVCGRKRTAIEEELEVLYDAYYEELEQYANQQQFPSQSSLTSSKHMHRPHRHNHNKITEVIGSEDSEDSYVEDDDLDSCLLTDEDELSDEEEYSDDEEEYEERAPSEFFKFGNSLTVKGGILTVADDLLRNDGKKFIEMMEQLAERRMQREEEAATEAREYDEEEDDDDYDDEDDIDSEDYDDDDDDQDALTEEQRMAEGRRMFQIFAARMFEQRVLTAYREKVAQERQARLLQELEMEDSREKERELKKQKEKERKKDKKRQLQLKKEEEKLRIEAEKAAEEAALKAEEERKVEEARKRKEEMRAKKEAEKKQAEAERQRKEDEKRKKLAEDKAKEQKRLDQLHKEKVAKEEAHRRERESKEQALKEAKAKQVKTVTDEPKPLATPQSSTVPRRVSPIPKPGSPAVSAFPAVPKNLTPAKDIPLASARAQDIHVNPSASLGYHQQAPNGQISPQPQIIPFATVQQQFSRNTLGHPPSMPVPLPPPGIGSHQQMPAQDVFGFNSPQQTPIFSGNRSNNNMPLQPGHSGPFQMRPSHTSPPNRMGNQPNNRMPQMPAYNMFTTVPPHDEPSNDGPISFGRRSIPTAENNNSLGLGAIGAIGRPSPARAISQAPVPIQRPISGAPQRSRFGFNGKNDVMGSRALLDDDDPVIGNAQAAFSQPGSHRAQPNGWSNPRPEEPFAPPPSDRWTSLGAIGPKDPNTHSNSSWY